MSFGAIATDYDRLRPSPPPVAVRWLLPARCEVAVDLAAGTGLLTRALAAEVSDVVAVEPDARMASVLKARSPGVHVVSGRESVSASEYRRRRRDVHLPDAAAFANAQDASFTFTRSMTVDDLVAMLGTYSGLITASPASAPPRSAGPGPR